MPHALFTLLAAFLLAIALAAIENRPLRERAYVAARIFLCSVVAVFGGSWVMRLIHG